MRSLQHNLFHMKRIFNSSEKSTLMSNYLGLKYKF